MASCSCGTRDKPKPVSPLSRGLWLPGCCMRLAFRNWADIFLMLGALGPNGLGAPSRFLSSAPLRVRIPPLAHKKAPWAVMGSGRSVLMAGTEGFRVRLVGGRVPLRRFAPCVLRWKTLRVSSAPHPVGFESGRMGSKKPATARVTGSSIQMVPPAGFEPAISTLKGWRPWPLDDGDSGKEYSRLF